MSEDRMGSGMLRYKYKKGNSNIFFRWQIDDLGFTNIMLATGEKSGEVSLPDSILKYTFSCFFANFS